MGNSRRKLYAQSPRRSRPNDTALMQVQKWLWNFTALLTLRAPDATGFCAAKCAAILQRSVGPLLRQAVASHRASRARILADDKQHGYATLFRHVKGAGSCPVAPGVASALAPPASWQY